MSITLKNDALESLRKQTIELLRDGKLTVKEKREKFVDMLPVSVRTRNNVTNTMLDKVSAENIIFTTPAELKTYKSMLKKSREELQPILDYLRGHIKTEDLV